MKYFNPPRDNLKGKQKDIMDQFKKIASFDKYWFWHGLWHSHQTLRKQDLRQCATGSTFPVIQRRLRHLKLQILLHYFRNFFLFPFFLFKFLLPSFMKGKNNVWKNIKTIIKEKEFKPLRIAILSQLVFTLILTQLSILVYQYYTNPSRTATMFLTQTNWGGGASTTLSASHSSDQTGWSRFYSISSADVNTSVAGEVSLSPSLNSTVQTSDTDFNTWTKASTLATSSTGSTGRIVLLKPDGATCNQGSECRSTACSTGNLCYTPPCGSSPSSTIYSGQTYNLVNIGTQCWFAQNLNVGTKLAAGSTLPSNNSLIEKWCYSNSDANCTTYGGLYTWAEANQLVTTCNTNSCTPSTPSQGICPSGWHIPTDTEIKTLESYLGMCAGGGAGCVDAVGWRGTDQGTKLKSGGSSGFNMLLGGTRLADNSFVYLGTRGYFWSASEVSASTAWFHILSSSDARVYNYYDLTKVYGFSVRCLKN